MSPFALPTATLAGGFLLIVTGSALFTRSLESTVARFFENRNRGLRILGNLSLSLPELILPLIAFLTPGASRSRIDAGTGALFGPPLFLGLVLLPLAFFLHRPQARTIIREAPLLVTGLAAALLLFGHSLLSRLFLALCLLAVYLGGLFLTPGHEEGSETSGTQAEWGISDALFLGGGALMMGLGSQTFLSGIEALREIRGISPFWTALLLGPIATEAPELLTLTHFLRKRSLPEAFSILWGSIHLQTTLSVAVGILASPWLGSPGAIHAGFALGGLLGLLLLPAILRRSRTSEGDPR